MFCDQTSLHLESGNGGSGCISFYRAKYLPKGGPDGGDGGKGGSVFIRSSRHLNSLIELHTKKYFSAEKGQPGSGRSMHGKQGDDLYLEVPVGTQIRNSQTQEVLHDFAKENEVLQLLEGGRGGYGNEHFKSSIRQAPRFAELGEPGKSMEIDLELKLVADIGIIGLPSAGKSTLISVISSAKPKIAEYHFTTLIPNLGVVNMGEGRSFVACDIPGLIEGASNGKGLGDEFLRHITRSKSLIHLVDISRPNPLQDYAIIRNELEKYSTELAEKEEIVVFSKSDTLNQDKELLEFLQDAFYKETSKHPLYISSVTHEGIQDLTEACWEVIEHHHKKEYVASPESSEHILFQPHTNACDPKHFTIEKEIQPGDGFGKARREGYRITGIRFEQIVVMSDLENREAFMRVRDVMEKMGIQKKLIGMKVPPLTPLFVGEKTFGFEPLLLK